MIRGLYCLLLGSPRSGRERLVSKILLIGILINAYILDCVRASDRTPGNRVIVSHGLASAGTVKAWLLAVALEDTVSQMRFGGFSRGFANFLFASVAFRA